MLERRCRQEPLAYIVGRKEFWSLDFRVTSDTLIPRSDSEVIIETLAVRLFYTVLNGVLVLIVACYAIRSNIHRIRH